jgi:hypothetical protein
VRAYDRLSDGAIGRVEYRHIKAYVPARTA